MYIIFIFIHLYLYTHTNEKEHKLQFSVSRVFALRMGENKVPQPYIIWGWPVWSFPPVFVMSHLKLLQQYGVCTRIPQDES